MRNTYQYTRVRSEAMSVDHEESMILRCKEVFYQHHHQDTCKQTKKMKISVSTALNEFLLILVTASTEYV
jgi:hypothetical protein